ncbi:MAG: hypothetical protein KJO82_13220 [Gammaproteobacteria bacterium]|nr:hypothetical protein [Gammaproteobacteria bacterium]
MNHGRDKRRSFRVSESVYLKVERLTDDEYRAGLAHRKVLLGETDSAQSQLIDIEARLSEAMYLLSAESDQVGKCMTLMNDKLNVVIGQLPGMRATKMALAKSPPQTCDVGADGLVFASAENFAVGTKLYMQFLLSTDSRYVESFCSVVRHTEPPDGNDTATLPYGIAVEFSGMSQSQREILIQHMFNRESETLRMRRLQIEAEEFD